MAEANTDIWAQWLLRRRHGGDPVRLKATLDHLYPVRDTVLSSTRLQDGGTLLDVGCGDGLIAFGALQQNPRGKVIFADISQDLLGHAAALAQDMNMTDRCQFLCASAEDLTIIPDASVDAVTTRSVLIYVANKQQAIGEFYRVLKPGGRLSVFEPINRFGLPEPAHMFWGMDVTPVIELAARLKAVYERLQPIDSDPMLNFDERDLIALVEMAGFREVHLDLEVDIKRVSQLEDSNMTWDSFIGFAPNPKIPTLAEAMAQALSEDEAVRFTAHVRPLVEDRARSERSAVAYLAASK